MQITLSSQQSKALEALSQQGGYTSLEDAIDTALLLLADEVTSYGSMESPKYLAWAEQTRQKIEEGVSAAKQGAVFDAADVLAQLREKVKAARSASV
jgi:antitoxin ParD1/3/4